MTARNHSWMPYSVFTPDEASPVPVRLPDLRRTVYPVIAATLTFIAVLLMADPSFVRVGKSRAATFPGDNGKIAFVTNRDGNVEIYTMDADGNNQMRLTDNQALDDEPA